MPRHDPPPVVPIVDWRKVMNRACTGKHAYPTAAAARSRVRWLHRHDQPTVACYRCPFADGRPHWHVGHPPDWAAVRRIAAAIRARAQDPTAREAG